MGQNSRNCASQRVSNGNAGRGGLERSYFDISRVETLIPLHNSIMRPAKATATRNLVRVIKTRIALHGGIRALADFHVTPPLGRSIFPSSRAWNSDSMG